MRKGLTFGGALVALLCLSAVTLADEIEMMEITLTQTFGVGADYDAGSKTLVWDGGDGGAVYITGNPFPIIYDESIVTATFANCVDLNIDGPKAQAVFDNSSFSVELKDGGVTKLLAEGYFYTDYLEEESGDTTNYLIGKGRIIVTNIECYIDGCTWGSTNNRAGVKAFTTLGSNIDDYQSDWSSDNVIIAVYADETLVVPEPVTVMLLGLGATALIRRRRNA